MRRSYTPEKSWAEMEGELPSWLLYRPLSFYLTPPLLNAGIPIAAVTLSSGLVALAMLAVAWRGGPYAYLVVAGLGFVFHVLDCVDGNMARTSGRSSGFGALLDGFIDRSFWCALFASLGLLVAHAGGGVFGPHAVEAGLGLAALVLLNRQTRDSLTMQYAQATYFRAQRPQRLGLVDRLLIGVVGLENLYVFAIALGGALGRLDQVLVGVAVYVVGIFIGAIVMTFDQARKLDRAVAPGNDDS